MSAIEPRIFLDISIEDMAKKIFLSGTHSRESIVHNLLKIFPDKLDDLKSFVQWVETQDTIDKGNGGWPSTWLKPTKGGE
tara:strand:- start:852 stop:1091 length:240 start_codon:yes stop_codon:yes gene_type:complete